MTIRQAAQRAVVGHDACTTPRRTSLLEVEVQLLLEAHTSLEVKHDTTVQTPERKYAVDLHLPALGWYVDLDPLHTHKDPGRDARKSARMLAAGVAYHRVREMGLTHLAGDVHWAKVSTAVVFAEALRQPLEAAGCAWRSLEEQEVAEILSKAHALRVEGLASRPENNLTDKHEVLAEEFVRNISRPGVGPDWLAGGSADKVEWCCKDCGRVWVAVVNRRTSKGNGCASCSGRRSARARIEARKAREQEALSGRT
jgi:hypothetical protein